MYRVILSKIQCFFFSIITIKPTMNLMSNVRVLLVGQNLRIQIKSNTDYIKKTRKLKMPNTKTCLSKSRKAR